MFLGWQILFLAAVLGPYPIALPIGCHSGCLKFGKRAPEARGTAELCRRERVCIPSAPAASRDVSSITYRGDTPHIYALVLLLSMVLGLWVPKVAWGGAGKSKSSSWCLSSDLPYLCSNKPPAPGHPSLVPLWRWTCWVRGSSLGNTGHPWGTSGCGVEGLRSLSCESLFPCGDGKASGSLGEILTQFSCQRLEAARFRSAAAPLPSSAGAGRRPAQGSAAGICPGEGIASPCLASALGGRSPS